MKGFELYADLGSFFMNNGGGNNTNAPVHCVTLRELFHTGSSFSSHWFCWRKFFVWCSLML